jgi:hypothetical protein
MQEQCEELGRRRLFNDLDMMQKSTTRGNKSQHSRQDIAIKQ